jgi:putative FmdB family regulatory protein
VPEYEYKCDACENAFSVRKSISEARRDEVCPVCGGKTRKVFGAPAVHGSSCSVSSGGGFS